MSKYFKTEMREGVDASTKGEMSQPGKAAMAERSQVAGIGELVEKVLDAS